MEAINVEIILFLSEFFGNLLITVLYLFITTVHYRCQNLMSRVI